MATYKEMKLWKNLELKLQCDENKNKKILMVEECIESSINILDRIIETFPTYTLHNKVHSENVVYIMGELLEGFMGKITALEITILLLSAYYHDIGMVYDAEEREGILKNQRFSEFLRENSDAYINYYQKSQLTDDVAQLFCRWNHAYRAEKYINNIDDDKISWENICLKDKLRLICLSHNEDISFIKDNEKFNVDYLYEGADLKFCAIILRIADILDFDNSRSPKEVYKHLKINTSKDKLKSISDLEWRKHLCSNGFVFNLKEGNIGFIANPDNPVVEYDIRQFLNIIESELKKCNEFLSGYNSKWSNFRFPSIQFQIYSRGYEYGEYFFSIDKEQIIQLLIGEDLYSDTYVFIRELIQNSIDTTRHRIIYEKFKGKVNYKPKAINISKWIDEEGYTWIRIDDFGMGMNKEIILNYFLKVGVSYYKSTAFKSKSLEYKMAINENFNPISKFGIGILSCFIACNKIIVETKYIDDSSECIQLFMDGIHNFYVMKTEDTKLDYIPSKYMSNPRIDSGTSIALRLDPHKEKYCIDLDEIVNKYLFCPPVPISIEGKEINENIEFYLKDKWTKRKTIKLTAREVERLEKTLRYEFKNKEINIEIIPVDLSNYSNTISLKGQGVMCFLKSKELMELLDNNCEYEERIIDLSLDNNGLVLEAGYYVDDDLLFEEYEKLNSKIRSTELYIGDKISDLESELNRLKITSKNLVDNRNNINLKINLNRVLNGFKEKVINISGKDFSRISYNGMVIDNNTLNTFLKLVPSNASEMIVGFIGVCLVLSDEMKLELTVSRELIKDIPWNLVSNVSLAFQKFIDEYKKDIFDVESLQSFLQPDDIKWYTKEHSLKEIMTDRCFIEDDGWSQLPIINTTVGLISIKDIVKNESKQYEYLGFKNVFWEYFYTKCSHALVQINLNIYMEVVGITEKFIIQYPPNVELDKNILMYPPLFFVTYKNSKLLRIKDYPLNINHPFSKWLIVHSDILCNNYKGFFNSICDEISKKKKNNSKDNSEFINDIVNKINSILKRLGDVSKEIIITKEIYLTESDFKL